MAITVVAPVLNEIRFIKAWFANVSKWADEIIVCDTGSTDGSIEFLESQGIKPLVWEAKLNIKRWGALTEGKVRNFLLEQVKSEWIVPLDADELASDEMVAVLKALKVDEKFYIGRFTHYFFWENIRSLRVRSLKPLLFFKGRFYPLRNWRGNYPGKTPRLLKNNFAVKYSEEDKHCLVEYKGFGHLSYHLPGITQDFDAGFFHYHYAVDGKKAGSNKDWERGQPVKTVEYAGKHPKEIELIEGLVL